MIRLLRYRLALAWLRLVQPLCERLAPHDLSGLDFIVRLEDSIDALEKRVRVARKIRGKR